MRHFEFFKLSPFDIKTIEFSCKIVTVRFELDDNDQMKENKTPSFNNNRPIQNEWLQFCD